MDSAHKFTVEPCESFCSENKLAIRKIAETGLTGKGTHEIWKTQCVSVHARACAVWLRAAAVAIPSLFPLTLCLFMTTQSSSLLCRRKPQDGACNSAELHTHTHTHTHIHTQIDTLSLTISVFKSFFLYTEFFPGQNWKNLLGIHFYDMHLKNNQAH